MTAVRLGTFTREEEGEIRGMVRFYGLPDSFEGLKPADIIESMYHDKKVMAGKVRYILPDSIGKVRIVSDIPHAILTEVLEEQRK
jgi:3-dehydroquinate synthase